MSDSQPRRDYGLLRSLLQFRFNRFNPDEGRAPTTDDDDDEVLPTPANCYIMPSYGRVCLCV